jgi:hypothetical protein
MISNLMVDQTSTNPAAVGGLVHHNDRVRVELPANPHNELGVV